MMLLVLLGSPSSKDAGVLILKFIRNLDETEAADVERAHCRMVSNVREMKLPRDVLRERGPPPATQHLGLRP
jgi:hypothetical protein